MAESAAAPLESAPKRPMGLRWRSTGATGQVCTAASCTALGEASGPGVVEGRRPGRHCHARRSGHPSQGGFPHRGAPICRVDLQVTIVAVLQKLGANEDLFALVFGESCLNDAVGCLAPRCPLPMCSASNALACCTAETLRHCKLVRLNRAAPSPQVQSRFRVCHIICTSFLTLRSILELRNSLICASHGKRARRGWKRIALLGDEGR